MTRIKIICYNYNKLTIICKRVVMKMMGGKPAEPDEKES